jgi:hypothetical protein
MDSYDHILTERAIERMSRRVSARRKWRRICLGLSLAWHALLPGGGAA